ncbi:MAG TPA: division/cell wall cluster transcriptional repressor MraZ [Nitrospirae bacterium]|nr:division/cell wall cluster transcriptional repressor MraZ [Nitrospirota bacterium]
MVYSGGLVSVFYGKYYNAIDSKGRAIIPAPFRDIIKNNYSTKLYVTNAPLENCLNIYPQEEWLKLQEKVRKLPRSDRAMRVFRYRVIASAQECELDKQGRILIPLSLREDGRLNSDVVVVGQIDWIELWNREEWDKVVDPSGMDSREYEERLAELGL